MSTTISLFGRELRLVDLSHPLNDPSSEPVPSRLERFSHRDGADMWEALYGIPPEALPLGAGFAGEIATASTHAATHVDAPWHYARVAEGSPAETVEQLPLGWFVGPLVVLDVSELGEDDVVTPSDVDDRLARLDHQLSPGDIVAFQTGAQAWWGSEDYWEHGCGLGREAVLHLVDRGVRVIGTDAWSLDRPYPRIGRDWAEQQDRSTLWPAHFAGIERRYSQIEKLANLGAVPAVGVTVFCFPVKVVGASGAWARAVAAVPAA